MEPLGAAASVLAIVEIVGRVSASAASFMRDIKDARKDMIQVRKDMSDLSTVLRMVAEDLDSHDHGSPSRAGDMPHSQQHIVDIAHSCGTVLLDIELVLREGRSRLVWVTSGKERVDRLRVRLETCKLSLDVALDYRTMVVVHDIKEDSNRIVGDVSAIQRDVALILGKVDNIELKAAGGLDIAGEFTGGVMLDRFLNECRSDAQTVLDNIEYQQDQDFQDARPKAMGEKPKSAQDFNTEFRQVSTSSSPSPTVLLKTTLGHEHEIPLEQCRTWPHMDEIIKCSYPHDSADAAEINRGRYTLYHDGQAVLPESWDTFVGPGRKVSLKLWKDEMVHFWDCSGRTHKLPWSLVKTWKGMEDVIKQIFCYEAFNGPHVLEGYYDLKGLDGAIILPLAWEQSIKPGMRISMTMWPLPVIHKITTGKPWIPPLPYMAMTSHWARRREQRLPPPPPAPAPRRVSLPPMAKGRPPIPTWLLASENVRQKQDTGQGSSNPKKTQQSPAPWHLPKRRK